MENIRQVIMTIRFFLLLSLLILTVSVTAQKRKIVRIVASDMTDIQLVRVPGQLFGGSGDIAAPSEVTANTEFDVTVETYGNGCHWMGDTSVILDETSADIFVYDKTSATQPGTVCTLVYREFDHKVRLKFGKKGEAVVRIWARYSGDLPMGKPVVIERKIIVK